MGTKIIVTFLFSVFCCACATSEINQRESTNEVNYAIAYCLSQSYPETQFSSDATYVAGSYLQKGGYGIDMYEKIRNYVEEYRTKVLASKHGKNLDIMQCINLYESKALRDLISKDAGE